MPNKYIVTLPKMYTVTCGCKKNCSESAASLVLYAQIFPGAVENNVVPKFTNTLIWILHKICKHEGFF